MGRSRGVSSDAEQLLGVEEVAHVLGVGQVTVWRWCRDGSLPCAKIGRKWRVRWSALDEFVRRSERSRTLTGQLRNFVEVPDNVLAVAQDAELMRKLDVAYLQIGEARNGVLVKYQIEDERVPSLDDLRAELRENGMDVERLEDEGRLRLLADAGEHGGRVEEIRRLLAEAYREEGGKGGRALWINFNWDLSLGLEDAVRQQAELSELVEEDPNLVVMTTVLEEKMDGWPGAELRRAQVVHAGTVWLSRSGVAMGRVLPPPAL